MTPGEMPGVLVSGRDEKGGQALALRMVLLRIVWDRIQ